MAKVLLSLPAGIIKDFERLNKDADKIFGAATKAGAEKVAQNVRSAVPVQELAEHVRISRTYKTPSDDGINTKVYFSGYLSFKGNRTEFRRRGRSGSKVYTTTKGVPAEFVAQTLEYGTTLRTTEDGQNRGLVLKRPFFRKSFRASQISAIMKRTMKNLSGGLIDE